MMPSGLFANPQPSRKRIIKLGIKVTHPESATFQKIIKERMGEKLRMLPSNEPWIICPHEDDKSVFISVPYLANLVDSLSNIRKNKKSFERLADRIRDMDIPHVQSVQVVLEYEDLHN